MKIDEHLSRLRQLRRRVRRDEVQVEWNAAMGRVFTIPADPRPQKIELSDDGPGWVSLEELRKRYYR
jgi:hypothetical protein